MADLLYCHAFHLDQPAWTADGCMNNDIGLAGEALFEEFRDHSVVGYVAQIDHNLSYIVERAFCLGEQASTFSHMRRVWLTMSFGCLICPLLSMLAVPEIIT